MNRETHPSNSCTAPWKSTPKLLQPTPDLNTKGYPNVLLHAFCICDQRGLPIIQSIAEALKSMTQQITQATTSKAPPPHSLKETPDSPCTSNLDPESSKPHLPAWPTYPDIGYTCATPHSNSLSPWHLETARRAAQHGSTSRSRRCSGCRWRCAVFQIGAASSRNCLVIVEGRR